MENFVDEFYKEKAALKNVNEHYGVVGIKLVEAGGEYHVVIAIDKKFHPNMSQESRNDIMRRAFFELQYGDYSLSTCIRNKIKSNMKSLRYRIKGDLEIKEEEIKYV